VLLDGWLLEVLAERLDIGRDVQRLDIGELAQVVVLSPGEEPAGGMEVSRPRVLVADRGREELEETTHCVLTGVGDDPRHDHGGRRRGNGSGRSGDGQLAGLVGGLFGHAL
jgi:hypothetical protein